MEHFERFLDSINKEKTILSKLKISFVMVNLLFENFTRLFTDYFGYANIAFILLFVLAFISIYLTRHVCQRLFD
jgi:hypothetical protein